MAARTRAQLLFVDVDTGRVVLDGLAVTRDEQGWVMAVPFCLGLRRPRSWLVETLLIDIFELYCDQPRLIEIAIDDSGTVRFHAAIGDFVMVLEDVVGLPTAGG